MYDPLPHLISNSQQKYNSSYSKPQQQESVTGPSDEIPTDEPVGAYSDSDAGTLEGEAEAEEEAEEEAAYRALPTSSSSQDFAGMPVRDFKRHIFNELQIFWKTICTSEDTECVAVDVSRINDYYSVDDAEYNAIRSSRHENASFIKMSRVYSVFEDVIMRTITKSVLICIYPNNEKLVLCQVWQFDKWKEMADFPELRAYIVRRFAAQLSICPLLTDVAQLLTETYAMIPDAQKPLPGGEQARMPLLKTQVEMGPHSKSYFVCSAAYSNNTTQEVKIRLHEDDVLEIIHNNKLVKREEFPVDLRREYTDEELLTMDADGDLTAENHVLLGWILMLLMIHKIMKPPQDFEGGVFGAGAAEGGGIPMASTGARASGGSRFESKGKKASPRNEAKTRGQNARGNQHKDEKKEKSKKQDSGREDERHEKSETRGGHKDEENERRSGDGEGKGHAPRGYNEKEDHKKEGQRPKGRRDEEREEKERDKKKKNNKSKTEEVSSDSD